MPRLEVTGKRPVWSVEILPVTLMDFKNAIFVWTWDSGGGNRRRRHFWHIVVDGRGGGDLVGPNFSSLLVNMSLGVCERLRMIFADELRGEAEPSSVIDGIHVRGPC